MKCRTTNYPPYLEACAWIIGGLRNVTNAEMNLKEERFRRPGPVNERGLFCELIAQHHLYTAGIEYEATPLLASTPQGKPDIISGGRFFDVKWVDGELRVNEEGHRKGRGGLTHYWFIKPAGGRADMWIVPYETVSSWEVQQLRYAPAYVNPLPNEHTEWLKAYGAEQA